MKVRTRLAILFALALLLAGASVALPSLAITALQLAVGSAVAAGATKLEAAAVVTEASELDGAGHAAVRDLAADAPIHVAAPDGSLSVAACPRRKRKRKRPRGSLCTWRTRRRPLPRRGTREMAACPYPVLAAL